MSQAPAPMVCVLGDLVEDVVVHLGGPLRRATDTEADIERRPGGSAANVARAVVAAGGRARLACRVGEDDLGDRLVTEIEAEGVEVVAERSGRSGSIVVLVDRTGERTMARDRGSSAGLAAVPAGFLDGGGALHLTLYSFEPGPVHDTAMVAADTARRTGVPVSLDLSSVAVLDGLGRRQVLELLDRLEPTVVLANEDEARWASSVGVSLGDRTTTVVKRGPDPALVWLAGRCHRVPAVPLTVPPADSTGAGDAFAAGYLVSCAAGGSPLDAATDAHRAAAQWLQGSADG